MTGIFADSAIMSFLSWLSLVCSAMVFAISFSFEKVQKDISESMIRNVILIVQVVCLLVFLGSLRGALG